MNVTLSTEAESIVLAKVRSGDYRSESEVVQVALRLLEERDRLRDAALEELRVAVRIGIVQADRGELLDGPTFFDAILSPRLETSVTGSRTTS